MEKSSDFGTDTANQAGVDIRVMAGRERESPEPLDCKDGVGATLSHTTKLPARSPIRVKFAIDRDGRLMVTATDLTGGGSIDVEVETAARLDTADGGARAVA